MLFHCRHPVCHIGIALRSQDTTKRETLHYIDRFTRILATHVWAFDTGLMLCEHEQR